MWPPMLVNTLSGDCGGVGALGMSCRAEEHHQQFNNTSSRIRNNMIIILHADYHSKACWSPALGTRLDAA